MSELNELYKCNVCGNIVEVVCNSYGQLVCCNQAMEKLEAKKHEEGLDEKHLPVLKKDENDKYVIVVGEIIHPMIEEHHIMFIEAISKDNKYLKRVYLKPNEIPELSPDCICHHLNAREYCNIHGLFESELNKEN